MSLVNNTLKTFPMGGVHPEENKITASQPIKKLAIPEEVIIPISQHIGARGATRESESWADHRQK